MLWAPPTLKWGGGGGVGEEKPLATDLAQASGRMKVVQYFVLPPYVLYFFDLFLLCFLYFPEVRRHLPFNDSIFLVWWLNDKFKRNVVSIHLNNTMVPPSDLKMNIFQNGGGAKIHC